MRRFTRSRSSLLAVALVAAVPLLLGQAPPPQPLPASITGQTTIPTVQPATGTQTASAAPIQRFQNFQALPPETVQAVVGMRSAADWLWRMNQPNGRFVAGLNPALKHALPDDPDFRQAMATLALSRAARFTGDERFTVRAEQSALALLTLTKVDAANPGLRVPIAPSKQCNRVGFAAVLAMAIYELPNADPKRVAEADALCAFVQAHVGPEGEIQTFDHAGDAEAKADPDSVNVYPGLALQALAMNARLKPAAGKFDMLTKSVAFYRAAFKAQPHPMLAATMLPAITDLYLQAKNPHVAAAGFELADALCNCQYTRLDAQQSAWIGGFHPAGNLNAEPSHDAATCAMGLAAAATLTRHVPDLTRFVKYRQACVDGQLFARSLQFTDENADHFEKLFRARYLTGGVHLSPSNGTVRIDATGQIVLACVRFLESGAEMRGE